MWTAVGVCVLYAVSSVSLSFTNKAVFSVIGFQAPLVLLLIQFAFNVTTTPLLNKFWPAKWKGKVWRVAGVPNFYWTDFVANLPLAITFLSNVSVGLYGLSKVNIPMFLCIRRLCVLFVFLSDALVLKKPTRPIEIMCVGLICSGALVAGLNDLTADPVGYCLVLLNNILTTLQLQLNKKLSHNPNLNAFGQSFNNALSGLPVMLLICFFSGDIAVFLDFPMTRGFFALILISVVLGCLLTVSQALCTIVTSAMATTIAGNLKVRPI